jgi:hypothetical protein
VSLVVGPRILPGSGVAQVWVDTGSGPGHVREVPVELLTLAPIDDGQGKDATYVLHPQQHSGAGR